MDQISVNEMLFFYVAIKPRNIPKIYREQLTSEHFLLYNYIITGHLHSEVYRGISADFYDSVWLPAVH
jgi:hypothetical protein